MKYYLYLIFALTLPNSAQKSIEATLIEKKELDADAFISSNNFETIFYVLENVLFENSIDTKETDIGYNNFKLGNITSVNTFNPLKINVFYKDFNTALILDNRLAEMFKIDFNTLSDYKNISHISTGADNTLWVFNENTLQLELFDYKTNTTRAKTLPIKNPVLDIKSNYNFCWVLTKTHLYKYDYFGNLAQKTALDAFETMAINNENIVLKKGNTLSYLKKDSEAAIPISLPNLLINQFFVTNQTLYIYNAETLHKYQLKID